MESVPKYIQPANRTVYTQLGLCARIVRLPTTSKVLRDMPFGQLQGLINLIAYISWQLEGIVVLVVDMLVLVIEFGGEHFIHKFCNVGTEMELIESNKKGRLEIWEISKDGSGFDTILRVNG